VAVTGESIPPGLRVDAVATPRVPVGLQTTLPGPSGSSNPSGIDARSETGAGVGLVASERLPVSSRGRWVAVGGIAVVAVLVGFAVPKMMGKTEVVTAEPKAAESLPAATIPPPPPATAAVATTEPTTTPGTATPMATATTLAATARPGSAATAVVVRPRASASGPPATASAPPAPTPPRPPRGSDDDIK
jgi:hypothetical protein